MFLAILRPVNWLDLVLKPAFPMSMAKLLLIRRNFCLFDEKGVAMAYTKLCSFYPGVAIDLVCNDVFNSGLTGSCTIGVMNRP